MADFVKYHKTLNSCINKHDLSLYDYGLCNFKEEAAKLTKSLTFVIKLQNLHPLNNMTYKVFDQQQYTKILQLTCFHNSTGVSHLQHHKFD